jgi:predicted nucleotidyltransferase
MSADAVDTVIKGRSYQNEDQVWASFRMAGYGPVLTRLAVSAIEQDVKREEVYKLIQHYQKQGIIPPDQTVEKIIERAWFVASKVFEGLSSSDAHKLFRKGKSIGSKPMYSFDAGMYLRSFEVDSLKTGVEASLYVDKHGKLSCVIRTEDRKIKTPLKLPAKLATYLRFLVDSHFIPLKAQIVEKKQGFRIRISIKTT